MINCKRNLYIALTTQCLVASVDHRLAKLVRYNLTCLTILTGHINLD